MILPEPRIIPPGTENPEFWLNDQLTTLFQALQALSLTSRDGAIQHNDKAGNLSAVWVVFTSNGTANTEDAVTHGLGRVPAGILAALPDKAATVYDSGTTWTTTTIYTKSSAATVAWKLLVF